MLGKLNNKNPVKIIGAGFAGLSLAFRMKQLDLPFNIIENKKVGGKIQTIETEFGPVELAASTLYLDRHAVSFLRELNLDPVHSPRKLKRLIWNGKGGSSPISLPLFLRAMTGIHQSPPLSSSMEEAFKPLLGKKYVDELLSPALQGIYGTDACELYLPGIFPSMEGKHFSNYISFLRALRSDLRKDQDPEVKGSVSFNGGMQVLIDRLMAEVSDHMIPHESISAGDNLAICTNAQEASTLLSESEPEISAQLRRIQYVPVSSFTIFTERPVSELRKAFGLLIPQKYGYQALGIINQSELSKINYPGTSCYRVICKGEQTEKNNLFTELKTILPGLEDAVVLSSHLNSWKQGLPLFNKERSDAIREIKRLLANRKGLLLFGNYTGGISLRSMIAQSRSYSFM